MLKKFYLLTILKQKNMYANVYSDKKSLVASIKSVTDFPLRLFVLTETKSDKFDLCVIKVKGKYIAALGAKEKIQNDEYFTKCLKKEISIKDLSKV